MSSEKPESVVVCNPANAATGRRLADERGAELVERTDCPVATFYTMHRDHYEESYRQRDAFKEGDE